ncbi:hypothetical protein KM043_010782 [Ampulex compressa]|nr:hypothetical protein KM043_010782 [Ampulex compressa]
MRKVQVRSKSKIPENGEEQIGMKKSVKPEMADQLELIQKLREDPKIGFFYMTYAVDRSSEYFTPYALKVVHYKEVGKTYMTISTSGVTQYDPNEITFTPLELWEREYRLYLKLIKIRTFAFFRLWKAFYVWRKSITCRKFSEAKNYMDQNLFILDPILSKALLEVKSMCTAFLNCSFIDNSTLEKMWLFYFVEYQLTKLEDMRFKLDDFRKLASSIVNDACLDALLEAGYTPDDSNITIEQTAYGKLGQFSGVKFKMPKDGILRMSYIEQARKREKCYRLSCFIHLIDYMQTNMLYGLLLNTYKEFLKILKDHTKFLPDDALLEDGTVNVVIDDHRPSSDRIQHPYFIVDLLISVATDIVMDPTENIFRFVIKTIQAMWEENLNAIKPLLTDPTFHSFTRPTINRKVQGWICGNPSTILEVLRQDPIVKELKEELENIFNVNFDAIGRYCQRFRGIKEFYFEDMKFDEDIIRKNQRCDFFRQWCTRYRAEMTIVNEIIDYQPLGVFLLQFERFKKAAMTAPRGKMAMIESVMPGIGKTKVDALLSEAVEAIGYLESDPISTDDYVAYIKFVDTAQQRVDVMEGQLDYIKELYDTMEEYNVPVPAEDMANYLGISVHFTTLRVAVEKRLEERQKLISKFNVQLQKDIDALTEKVSDINDEVMQAWLLEAESNADACLETLKDLSRRLFECATAAEEYRAHQKAFKVEVTRFEILDHVTNELNLRILLWESVTSWAKSVVEWHIAEFETLNVEDVTAVTMRNLKNVVQLEKGLPPNDVLPKFKENVQLMKNKLPILGYLRNPSLKQRHWLKIESLLSYRFKPEEDITLSLLEKLGVFLYPNELMEIAAAASSEASLELLLKKIEDIWENLQFVIVPHKKTTDVFILGSLEEIQTAMDESNICIQTISASKHVGPIKPKVEEWTELLDLFTKTLDAWQYCQQQWLYLEAIFSAPDIQRQLPIEAKLFLQVDKFWKDLMRRTAKISLAMTACTQPGLLELLTENNRSLDQVMKCLEAYLETKRIAFPRFFFLSNDELLEILAQTKNPHAVQRHLQKCFDAIHRLEFATATREDESGQVKETVLTNDILAMVSPEGEKVQLGKGLKARGNVEDWLGKVEESMFVTLRKRMKAGINDLETRGRESFLSAHPSQDLNQLAVMVRGELPKLIRNVIINLITVDVHARDIVTVLVENKVESSLSFDWVKALRYYWDNEIDDCLARMSNAEYLYGYEYLGAQKRLVITPLTDKCYLCLMGALQLDLGKNPSISVDVIT